MHLCAASIPWLALLVTAAAAFTANYNYYTLLIPTSPSANQSSWAQTGTAWKAASATPLVATPVALSFPFPFYGVVYRSVSVVSSGFVSLTPYGATSDSNYFVAPLLADFAVDGSILYFDSGLLQYTCIYRNNM